MKVLIGDTIFTFPSGDGTAILSDQPSHAKVKPFAGQKQYLHFSVILRPCVLVRPRESNPPSPALQSNALPTQLILVISDVNECKKEPSPCYHEENTFCVNTKGSYHCKCKTGFSRKDNKCVGEYGIFFKFFPFDSFLCSNKKFMAGGFYFFLKVKECNRLGLGWP